MSIFDAYLQLVYSGQGVGELARVGGPGDNRTYSSRDDLIACQLVLHLQYEWAFIFSC